MSKIGLVKSLKESCLWLIKVLDITGMGNLKDLIGWLENMDIQSLLLKHWNKCNVMFLVRKPPCILNNHFLICLLTLQKRAKCSKMIVYNQNRQIITAALLGNRLFCWIKEKNKMLQQAMWLHYTEQLSACDT